MTSFARVTPQTGPDGAYMANPPLQPKRKSFSPAPQPAQQTAPQSTPPAPRPQSGGMDMSAYRPGQAKPMQQSYGSPYQPQSAGPNGGAMTPGGERWYSQAPQPAQRPAAGGGMMFAGGTPFFDERTGQASQPAFQMAPASTPWGQSMDPFAERDAFVNQINRQRMQKQIAFNSGGPTNPAAGMNPGIDYQQAMQQAGLGGGAPSMAPDYGDSLIARLNQQFGGSAYQPPGNFGGFEAGMMQQFAPNQPPTPGQYVNQQGEVFTGSMSFAPGTPQEYRDQAYGQYANRQGFFLQPVPAGQAFSPQPTPGFGFNEGYGFGGPSLPQPAQAPAEGTVRQDPLSGRPVTYSNGKWTWNPNPISGPQPFDVSRFGDAPPPQQPSPAPRPAEDDFFVGNWGTPPSAPGAPGKPASRQQEWEAAGRPGYDGNRPGYAVIGASRIDGTQFGYGAEADAYDKWLQGQGLRPGQANPVAPTTRGTPYENPFAQPGRSRGGGPPARQVNNPPPAKRDIERQRADGLAREQARVRPELDRMQKQVDQLWKNWNKGSLADRRAKSAKIKELQRQIANGAARVGL